MFPERMVNCCFIMLRRCLQCVLDPTRWDPSKVGPQCLQVLKGSLGKLWIGGVERVHMSSWLSRPPGLGRSPRLQPRVINPAGVSEHMKDANLAGVSKHMKDGVIHIQLNVDNHVGQHTQDIQ